VLLKFFELLTKNFLGNNKGIGNVLANNNDNEDFYESLTNSLNPNRPSNNSSIKACFFEYILNKTTQIYF